MSYTPLWQIVDSYSYTQLPCTTFLRWDGEPIL
nr:MAG TPA: hypothetical protein [Caudoviricetes sp.]DAZ61520.1 MAG TPA: hypothetical protein [Caudoviricetes sp.]